jgi:hypothetical protein
LGLVSFCLGFIDDAVAQSNTAIAEARRLAHWPSLAASLAFAARLLLIPEACWTIASFLVLAVWFCYHQRGWERP